MLTLHLSGHILPTLLQTIGWKWRHAPATSMENIYARSLKANARLELTKSGVGCLIFLFKKRDFYFYQCNETAAFLWKLCDGRHQTGQIIAALHEKSEISWNNAKKVVLRFFAKLLDEELITPAGQQLPCAVMTPPELEDDTKFQQLHLRPAFKKHCAGSLNPSNFPRRDKPVFTYLEVTQNCHLRCKHCYQQGHEGEDISLENIKAIVDQLVEQQVLMVCLLGGEPFLRRDFLEIVEYVASKGLRIIIVTSGTLLTRQNLERLLAIGIDRLAFSMEGACSETHNYIRGANVFDKVKQNITLALEIGVPVEISYTLDGRNFDSYSEIIKFAEQLGVPRIAISEFKEVGYGLKNKDEIAFSFKQNLIRQTRKFITQNRNKGECSVCIQRSCDALHSQCKIGPDGTINPCLFLNVPMGNIFEVGLEKVWNNRPVTDFLDLKKLKPPCRYCPMRDRCRSMCRAVTYYATGSYFHANPKCYVVKTHKLLNSKVGKFKRAIGVE